MPVPKSIFIWSTCPLLLMFTAHYMECVLIMLPLVMLPLAFLDLSTTYVPPRPHPHNIQG